MNMRAIVWKLHHSSMYVEDNLGGSILLKRSKLCMRLSFRSNAFNGRIRL